MAQYFRGAAFILRYLLENSPSRQSHRSSVIPVAPDGLALLSAYGALFPGRSDGTESRSIAARLGKLVREMTRAGLLVRYRQGNPGLRGVPRWHYVYSIPQPLLEELQSGALTPEKAVDRLIDRSDTRRAPAAISDKTLISR